MFFIADDCFLDDMNVLFMCVHFFLALPFAISFRGGLIWSDPFARQKNRRR